MVYFQKRNELEVIRGNPFCGQSGVSWLFVSSLKSSDIVIDLCIVIFLIL